MYSKRLLIIYQEGFLRVAVDSEICRKTSILHGHFDCARACSSMPKCGSNGQNILKVSVNTAKGIITNVFAIHCSYVSFNLQEL